MQKEAGLLTDYRLQSKESPNLLNCYKRYPVNPIRGEGAYLYDDEGRKYLDFISGIAVTPFGHQHPEIKKAVNEQLDNLWHVSSLFFSSLQEELASKLISATKLEKVFFCNSGTESTEAAIKFARKWGNGRSNIISTLGSFHGRTMGSLSASGQYKIWEGFQPLTPGFSYVPYNDINAVEYSITSDTVAVIVEPIQGESGINVPSENYLSELREICDQNDLLLILDEVQTGLGRTGKMFAYQWEDVKPDIVTIAKGIANGLPLGAVVCSEKVSDAITPGVHGSTFGGNFIAVSAAIKVMDLLTDELIQHVQNTGQAIKNSIYSFGFSSIQDIRGKGLMIGILFDKNVNAKEIALQFLNHGVIVGTAGDNVLRLLPPFIITENEIEIFNETFYSTLKESIGNY